MASTLGTQYSIKSHLAKTLEVTTVIAFDGMEYPKKPFITVKQLRTDNTKLSKARETIVVRPSYELGVFGTSLDDRTKMQDHIRTTIMFDDIPAYDNDGNPTGGSLKADVANEVTLDAEEISDKTKTHRMYFDINVENIMHKNRGNI